MKRCLPITLFTVCVLLPFASDAQRHGAETEITVGLPVTAFQPQTKGSINFSTGIIQSDAEASQIISVLRLKDKAFDLWMTENNPLENSRAAVIFVQHQFSSKALLTKKDDNDRAEICSDFAKLKADSLAIEKRLDEFDTYPSTAPSAEQLNYIKYLRDRLDSTKKYMEEAIEDYSASIGSFDPLDPIKSYIFHFEKNHKDSMTHSEYLLGTDKIYIVLIGGKADLAGSSITCKRGEKRMESDAKGIASLVPTFLSDAPLQTAQKEEKMLEFKDLMFEKSLEPHPLIPEPVVTCNLEIDTATIAVILIKIDDHILEIPGELTITPIGEDPITLKIHSRQWAGIQAGVLAGDLALRTYSLVGDSLTVAMSNEKTARDILPFVFIQVYPGRDVDRLSPFSLRNFKKKDLRNRIGFYAGVRLSKKPFQTFATGLSFALGPNVNLMGGVWLNRTLTVSDTYYVGPIKDDADILKYSKTSWPVYFSLGLSVSPSAYGDWFGDE